MGGDLAAVMRELSEPEFLARFGTEEQCLAVLFELRWGQGFTCERCGAEKYTRMKSRKHVQCNDCNHQTGFTAGTVFHSTKLPLTTWFRAIYELTQGKISSIDLAKRLGVRQPTAWAMKQKLQRSAGHLPFLTPPEKTPRQQRDPRTTPPRRKLLYTRPSLPRTAKLTKP